MRKLRFHSGTADVFVKDGEFLYVQIVDLFDIDVRAYKLTPVANKYNVDSTFQVNEEFLEGLSPATDRSEICGILQNEAEYDGEDNLRETADFRFHSNTAEVFDDTEFDYGFPCYLFAEEADGEILVRQYLDKGDGIWEVSDHFSASLDYLRSLTKTMVVPKIIEILKMEASDDVQANAV